MDYYIDNLKRYFDFNGRARRAEFWMFTLCSFVVSIVCYIIDTAAGLGLAIQGLYGLAVLFPSLGVACRRLHDTGKSGWMILIGIIPVLGWVMLFIWYVTDSTPGQNQYGPNPKGEAAPSLGT